MKDRLQELEQKRHELDAASRPLGEAAGDDGFAGTGRSIR